MILLEHPQAQVPGTNMLSRVMLQIKIHPSICRSASKQGNFLYCLVSYRCVLENNDSISWPQGRNRTIFSDCALCPVFLHILNALIWFWHLKRHESFKDFLTKHLHFLSYWGFSSVRAPMVLLILSYFHKSFSTKSHWVICFSCRIFLKLSKASKTAVFGEKHIHKSCKPQSLRKSHLKL